MGIPIDGKLNWLQHNLPEGLVVDAAWLQRRGYSGALRSKYVNHGWLELAARSLYRRSPAKLAGPDEEDGLSWQQVVVSLQTLHERRLTIGGRTALELQGFTHYLNESGPREIHLYGDEQPPRWVFKLKLGPRFLFHKSTTLFADELSVQRLDAASPDAQRGVSAGPGDVSTESFIRQSWGRWDWPLIVSTPERAILELLDEVPQHETFHQADVLMDGLRNLSPRRLRKLLTDCRSVKVKRLFFWFAERHDHAWLKALDRKGIDLGRGKRMLARGGKLDTKFNITVPENLDAGG